MVARPARAKRPALSARRTSGRGDKRGARHVQPLLQRDALERRGTETRRTFEVVALAQPFAVPPMRRQCERRTVAQPQDNGAADGVSIPRVVGCERPDALVDQLLLNFDAEPRVKLAVGNVFPLLLRGSAVLT